METKTSKTSSARYIAVTGILAAVAWVLQLIEFPVPVLIPAFIKFDFSDLPALLGAFALGPLCGVLIELVKNILHSLVSQSFGARDREGLTVSIGNCLALSFIATIIIMVVGPLVTMPLLTLLGTPASIIYWCSDYLKIYFFGIFFSCFLYDAGMSKLHVWDFIEEKASAFSI